MRIVRPRTRRARRASIGVLAVLAGAGALAISSVSSSAAPAKTSTKTVTLGMVWSLSGLFSPYGLPAEDGVKLAEQQINAAGGIKIGKTHYKMALNVLDDQSTPSVADSDATQLIEDDHVKVIVGPIANLATGVLPIAAQANVINLSSAGAASLVAGTTGYKLVFATLDGDAFRGSSAGPVLKKFVPQAKKVAIVWADDTANAGLVPFLESAIDEDGMSYQEFEYPLGTTDLSTVMSQVAAYNPDVIYECCTLGDFTNQTAAYNAAGIGQNVVTIANGGAYANASLTGGRPYIADPVQEADFTVPHPTPGALKFRSIVAKYLGGVKNFSPNEVAVEFFYDSIKILAAAMQKAGTVTNTAAIAKAMHEVKAIGAGGLPVGFDSQNAVTGGLDYTYVDGSTAKTLSVPYTTKSSG